MNGISTKVGASALAGALTGILVWLLTATTSVVIPPEVAVSISVVITFLVGFFVPEKAGINAADAEVSTTITAGSSDDVVDAPEHLVD